MGLEHSIRSLGHEVAQRARSHALLAEAWQHVGDVVQVGPVRADEQDTAPVARQLRIRIEEIRGAVQGDHCLARAWPAVDYERAAGSGPDNGVLVRGDGGQHVPHVRRAARAEACDEPRLVVERRARSNARDHEGLVLEHLVPVVGDLPTCPVISPAACQSHRVGMRRAKERFRRR